MNVSNEQILNLIDNLTNTIFEDTENDLYNTDKVEDSVFALTLEDRLISFKNAYSNEDYRLVEKEAKSILKSLNLSTSDNKFNDICKLLLQSHINNLKIISDKIDNGAYYKPKINPSSVAKTAPIVESENERVVKEKVITLSEAYELYEKHMLDTEKWNIVKDKNNMRDDRTRFKFLALFAGAKTDIKSLKVNDFNNYASTLRKLPSSFFTKNKYKNLTLKQMLKAKGDGTEISKRTVGNYVGLVNRFFTFLYEKNKIDRNIIVDIIHMSKQEKENAKKERYSFKELQKWYDYAMNIASEEYKWITLIAIFNGCSVSEIVRLEKKNIFKFEDIWCLEVEATEEKETKNMNRIRKIPIHLTLIKLGLLDYFDTKKGKLFNVSNSLFSRDMTDINREYVTTNPKRTFHRIRANFINYLIQSGKVDKTEYIAGLAGHSQEYKIAFDSYADKINVGLLSTALKVIDYKFQNKQKNKA